MALIDDVKNEIMAKAHKPANTECAEPKRKATFQNTAEERAAYIARKQAEEERRYLKQQEAEKRGSKKHVKPKKEMPVQKAMNDSQKSKPRPRQRPRQNAKPSCAKARPRTLKTIGLPDGGSLIIIYMPRP